MFLKNKNFIKLIILLIFPLGISFIYFEYKNFSTKTLTSFQEFIQKHNKNSSVEIFNNAIFIKNTENNFKLLKFLLQLNVKIEILVINQNKLLIKCLPEEVAPRKISLEDFIKENETKDEISQGYTEEKSNINQVKKFKKCNIIYI